MREVLSVPSRDTPYEAASSPTTEPQNTLQPTNHSYPIPAAAAKASKPGLSPSPSSSLRRLPVLTRPLVRAARLEPWIAPSRSGRCIGGATAKSKPELSVSADRDELAADGERDRPSLAGREG